MRITRLFSRQRLEPHIVREEFAEPVACQRMLFEHLDANFVVVHAGGGGFRAFAFFVTGCYGNNGDDADGRRER